MNDTDKKDEQQPHSDKDTQADTKPNAKPDAPSTAKTTPAAEPAAKPSETASRPTTDKAATKRDPASKAEKMPATWPGKLALPLALIALGASGYLYWQGWQLMQSNQNQQTSLTQQVETTLAKTQAEVADRVAGVSQQLGQLQARTEAGQQHIDELQQRLTDAIKQVSVTREISRKDWLLAEAEYLLRLANQRVLMEQTASGALTLLKGTDQILRETDDVTLYDVRKALAEDIAALEAVPALDTEGVYLKLAALSRQVDALRVTPITDRHQLPSMLEEITPEAVEQTWTEGAQVAWAKAVEKFEKLVVIQHRDEPVEPLLSPEQTYYLQQNLHLMLEQAQLALLQHKQRSFDASLSKARDWISTYFDPKDATSTALLRGIDELKTVNVAPELPDISGSLTSLKDYLSEMARLKQEAAQ